MRLPPISHRSPPRIAALLAVATVLAMPAATYAQQSPTGSDDSDAAMRNIQNNFAHMTQPPRTIDTINQELKQTSKARGGGGGGGGMGQHGGGRHGGRQAQQQDKTDSGNDNKSAATPSDSTGGSGGTASQ